MHTLVETRLLEAAAELRAIADGRRPQEPACGCEPVTRPLANPLDDYLRAMHNHGPMAQRWRNEPEALLCDLIGALRYHRALEAARLREQHALTSNPSP